jgi:Glyoxalase-like domain
LVAAQLAPLEAALLEIFDVMACHRDPAVAAYGLENVLLPFGEQFLEIVAPTRSATAAGRFLERRAGDGGYMVITQCDDHDQRRAHLAALGIRIAHEFKAPGFCNMQLHPRDTGGSFLEIDQQLGDGRDWLPAGPAWREHVCTTRVRGIAAAEIQADDPHALATHWANILQLPIVSSAPEPSIALGQAMLRFVPCADGRPEGLAGLDILTVDRAAILLTAAARGVVTHDWGFSVGGMRWYLL